MKVVVAIDSFKGSLSSIEAGNAIKEGILSVDESAQVEVLPLADGGEGTVDALITGMNAGEIKVVVTGPLGNPVECRYGILPETKTAIMEISQAAGLTLVDIKERNPLHTTTYGVGEMILDAIGRGCREFLIGIGGSATNDGGIGMLNALGCRFLNGQMEPLEGYGRDLEKIASIDFSGLNKALTECRFRVACDVNNPLCGQNGASRVFGPQKGADEATINRLDAGLMHYAGLVCRTLGKDTRDMAGTGAAGGLGYSFLTILNASLEPGVDIVIDTVRLEDSIRDADLVITGEGRLDSQTVRGKAPVGVAKLAKRYGVTVIALSGCTTEDAAVCNENGIDAFFPILQKPMTVQEAMETETSRKNIKRTAAQIIRLIKTVKEVPVF